MGWYYVITQEIRESFEGKEADVFAVINGFSQEGQGCFYGSLSLLSQFCGIKSKTTTQKILKSLVEKGAIVKGEDLHNGVKFCSYKVNKNWYGISKINMGGMSETDTNNKEYINKNTLSNKGEHRFQKPSLEDVRAYCISRSNKVDPEQFFNFYESKGWVVGKSPMKDWRAAVRTWEKREKEVAPRKRESRKESVFEHNLRVMDQMFGTNMHEQAYGKQGGQVDEQ
jgi:hypothetical protein